MLTEPVQAQALAREVELPIRLNHRIAVAGGPFGYVTVEALAIPLHGRQQDQVAALTQLVPQPPAQLIACLSFHGHLAIRAKLRSQPRKEQPDEMMHLR